MSEKTGAPDRGPGEDGAHSIRRLLMAEVCVGVAVLLGMALAWALKAFP